MESASWHSRADSAESEGSWDSRESSGGDEDFHLEMDENGIIGLREELLWEGESLDPEEGPWPEASRDLQDDLSELLGSDPLSPSPEELRHALSLCDLDRTGNSVAEDGVDEEEENMEEEQTWVFHGQQPESPPERDGQLEMTEEEQDREGSDIKADPMVELTSGGTEEPITKSRAASTLEAHEQWEDERVKVKPQEISTPLWALNTVPQPHCVPQDDILLTSGGTGTSEEELGDNCIIQNEIVPHQASVESQEPRISLYAGSEDSELGEELRSKFDRQGADVPSFPVPSPRKGKSRPHEMVLPSPTVRVDPTAQVSPPQSYPGLYSPTLKTEDHKNFIRAPKKLSKGNPCLDGYRRGQLSHRLPDFSQVEAKVRFPKGVYKPPKSKGAARGRGLVPEPPLVFKSPADIVKEVLLSGPDGTPNGPPSVSGSRCSLRAALPQEFRSPQQAHALVNQLQEDYNRLLTKYAEAENTIDRLRLEAKVNLYADPPKPSHSVYSGTVSTGSKVLNLTFPQAQKAVMMPTAALLRPAGPNSEQAGPGHDIPPSETSSLPQSHGLQGEGQLGDIISKQASQFSSRLDSFEDLLKSGKLKPSEQMKGLSDLAQGQDALERGYLEARDEHRHRQQQAGETGSFDPNRELEGQIFQSGMRLEELRERVGHGASEPPTTIGLLSPRNIDSPTPLLATPVSLKGEVVNQVVSSVSGEHEREVGVKPEEEDLPSTIRWPLQLKHEHVERDFSTLLDQYQSFKDLPHVLDLGHESGVTDCRAAHTPLPAADGIDALHSDAKNAGRDQTVPQAPLKGSTAAMPYGKPEPVPRKQKNSSLEEPHPRSSRDRRSIAEKSHCSSLTSLAESAPSERQAFKLHRTHERAPLVDGIVSPETDSGFVGSESSRLTAAARAPFQQRVTVSLPHPLAEKGVKSHPHPTESLSVSIPTRTVSQSGTVGLSDHLPSWRQVGTQGEVNFHNPTPTSSPQHWAGSITSDSATHNVSDRDNGQAVHSPQVTSKKLFPQQSPSPSSSHHASGPFRASGCGQLPGQHEAIQSLQAEVSRLKESLESSLRHTARATTTHAGVLRTRSASPRASRSVRVSADRTDAVPEEEWGTRRAELPGPASNRRSTSTPRKRLSTTSDPEHAHFMPSPEPSRHISTGFMAQGARRQAWPTFVTHGGHCAGPQHDVTLSSDEEGTTPGETESPLRPESRHHSLGKRLLKGATVPPAAHLRSQHCPLCKGSGRVCRAKRNGEPGLSVERDLGFTPHHRQPRNVYRSGPKGRFMETLPPPMLNTMPVVQCVPVYSSVLYYSSPVLNTAPTHPQSMYVSLGGSREDTRVNTRDGGRQPCRSHSADAEKLGRSLSRAIEVATNMNITSRRMAQSLAVELRHQRALTHSSLH